MPSNHKHNKIRAAVIGDPIGHSLSPALHGFWLDKYGINGSYDAIHVATGTLPDFLRNMHSTGLKGINITLPHKEAALPLMNRLNDTAQTIGAVNTVIIHDDGVLEGRNTDAYGFIQNIKQAAPDWKAEKSNVLILGAGGAARAAIVGLINEGCKHITITNRTRAKAVSLKQDINTVQNDVKINILDWENRSEDLRDYTLLVNTTQLGMQGQPPLEIDLSTLPKNAIVNDIVYNPIKTELLKQAEAKGLHIIDGIGMLLWQAQSGFEAWFGIAPEVDDALRNHVLSAMGQGA